MFFILLLTCLNVLMLAYLLRPPAFLSECPCSPLGMYLLACLNIILLAYLSKRLLACLNDLLLACLNKLLLPV